MRQSRLVAVMHVEEMYVHKKTFDCTADSLQSLAYEPFEIRVYIERLVLLNSAYNHELL